MPRKDMYLHFNSVPEFVIFDEDQSEGAIRLYLERIESPVCYVQKETDSRIDRWETEPLPPKAALGDRQPYGLLVFFMRLFHEGRIGKKDFEGWFSAWQEGRIEKRVS